jgi:hypothetical protein
MTKPPIFIGGMFKSGTSLLRAMLTQHRAIAGGLETYWFEVEPRAGKGRGGEPISDYLARLAAYFELPAAEVETMARQSPDAESFLDAFMARVAAAAGKPRWAEKTPGNITVAQRIRARWPKSPVLHIVRDPRDIYASLLEAKKWTSPDDFGSRWCAMFAGCEGGIRAGALTPANYVELRYEALVLDPETTMRSVVSFVGEEWDPAAGRFSGREDEFQVVLEQTGKASTTLARMRTPLSNDRVGLWRNVAIRQLDAVRTYVQSQGLGARYDRIVAATEAVVGQAESAT